MFIEQNGSYNTPYKYNGKELDAETGLYYYGARYYNPELSLWLSVDPLAEKYPSLSPYNYVANNPLKYIDPDGQKITYSMISGGGANGRDLMQINITGKLINFSDNNVDMQAALESIKASVESSFKGKDINGIDMQVKLDFAIAQSMKEVGADDHLVVLSEVNDKAIPGGVNDFGGMVIALDADYFTGLYDTTIGGQGERTSAHEVGHWFNLKHVRNPLNLMKQGRSELRGNWLNNNQLSDIQRRVKRDSGINIGVNTNSEGLPNLGKVKSLFSLKNTLNRDNRYNILQQYIKDNQ